jgi:uncharacterized membrane protein required for colicin V production
MVLNIVALLLVLGITFMSSLFGLYSGILNLMCTVTALAVSFGCYEPLNDLLTSQGLPPSFTEPAALVLLFVVTLLVLRTLSDTFLRGNVHVPMYVDWAGGAVCGFFAGQITIGVLVIGFLMLPWGGRAMMFSRYERDADNKTYREADDIPPDQRRQEERVVFRRKHLWLRSDDFAVGLFNMLSRGSLSGNTTFASVYPDFTEWVFWSGNNIQHESTTAPLRDEKEDGFKNGLKVETWWEQTQRLTQDGLRYRKGVPDKTTPKPPYEAIDYKPEAGHKLIGMRLDLLHASADRDKRSAYHRFRPSMIRLVGEIPQAEGPGEPREYIPQIIGGADANIGSFLRVVDLDNNLGLPATSSNPIDVYFEVDEHFEPHFVEYRRHARVAVSKSQFAKNPPAERLALAAEPTKGAKAKATGAARFIDTVNRGLSGDRDKLPFVLRLDKVRPMLDVQLDGLLLVSGRLSGDRSALELPEKDADKNVAKFKVPEGQRIFQLATKPRRANSLLGQAMDFAGGVTNQYQAFDDTGKGYPLVGYYMIYKKAGQEQFELVFLPDDPSFRGMVEFKDASVRKALEDQDDAVLGLIFLVPPNTGIAAVGSHGGRIDLGETIHVR